MAKNYFDTATINVSLYKKGMADRVAFFMNTQVWGIVLKKRATIKIEEHENGIRGAENLRGSILSDDQINAMIAAHTAEIEKIRKELKEQLEKEAKFDWLQIDNDLYKAFSKADTKALKHNALDAWFGAWGVKTNVQFNEIFLSNMGGRRMNTSRRLVNSGATEWTKARTKGDVMKVFYATLAELMIAQGAIKPAQIPDDIKAAYAKKERV